MMALANKTPVTINTRIRRHGLMTSFLASGRTEDFETVYDEKAARKFLKAKENSTEIVDVMYRFSERYSKSMSKKRYKKIAAICIVQGVEYNGCDIWNERLAEAKKGFILSESSEATEEPEVIDVSDTKEKKKKDKKKDKSESSKSPESQVVEIINVPAVIDTPATQPESAPQDTQQPEKVVDVPAEDVAEVVNFDTDSKFIPKPAPAPKKEVLFNMENLDVDLMDPQNVQEKYKKAFGKVEQVIKTQKPRGTKHKLTQLPSGLIELQLSTSEGNYMGTAMIDPYIIYGNRIYMQCLSEVGAVAVPLERHDLINKYLSGYTLTAQEAMDCKKFIFYNEDVYGHIDMSDVKEFRKMGTDDYQKFGGKLEKVLQLLNEKMEYVPRFRFSRFSNANSFELLADAEVKNPNGYQLYRPTNPIKVVIAGNGVSITGEDGQTKKYKIA